MLKLSSETSEDEGRWGIKISPEPVQFGARIYDSDSDPDSDDSDDSDEEEGKKMVTIPAVNSKDIGTNGEEEDEGEEEASDASTVDGVASSPRNCEVEPANSSLGA